MIIQLRFPSSNRIPEAAIMARSYLPSKVSEIVALWRKDLVKVNFVPIITNISFSFQVQVLIMEEDGEIF